MAITSPKRVARNIALAKASVRLADGVNEREKLRYAAIRAGLSFRPFDLLPHRELMAELDYWEHMERDAEPDSAIQKIAARHADRCIEVARARNAQGIPLREDSEAG
jgi:hypothetical protein